MKRYEKMTTTRIKDCRRCRGKKDLPLPLPVPVSAYLAVNGRDADQAEIGLGKAECHLVLPVDELFQFHQYRH